MGVNAQMADHPLDLDAASLGWRGSRARQLSRSLDGARLTSDPSCARDAWRERSRAARMFSSLLRSYFPSGDRKGEGVFRRERYAIFG
jgi:hypothetical protein